MMKRSSYNFSAITNQIGKIRRIATLRATHHEDGTIEIRLTVATVERPLNSVGDYMLGSFGDCKESTFYYQFEKEVVHMNRTGTSRDEFMSGLDKVDYQGIETLLEAYAKESHVSFV